MNSHSLDLCDGIIRYRADNLPVWEIPLADVRVIGEATNDHGPLLDDYFLCFATSPHTWYEASFYADGRDAFLQELTTVLSCQFGLSLVGSTDFESNVLWPPSLAGTPMFKFIPKRAATWIGRLFGVSWNTQLFADEVLAELKSQVQAKGSA